MTFTHGDEMTTHNVTWAEKPLRSPIGDGLARTRTRMRTEHDTTADEGIQDNDTGGIGSSTRTHIVFFPTDAVEAPSVTVTMGGESVGLTWCTNPLECSGVNTAAAGCMAKDEVDGVGLGGHDEEDGTRSAATSA